MSQGRFAVAGVRSRHSVAPAHSNPQPCLSAACTAATTGERQRPQIDRSGRRGFIRNLLASAAKGDAVTVEHHGVGDQPGDSNVPQLWRDEQYRYVSATAEGPEIHLSTPD